MHAKFFPCDYSILRVLTLMTTTGLQSNIVWTGGLFVFIETRFPYLGKPFESLRLTVNLYQFHNFTSILCVK